MKHLTLFFLFFSTLFAGYPYREIENPPIKLEDDIKIIVLSCDRTGSTLIYNILTYLFEDKPGFHTCYQKKVIKLHSFPGDFKGRLHPDKTIIVTTHRDPLNIVASRKCIYEKLRHKDYHCLDPTKNLPFTKEEALAFVSLPYEQFCRNNFAYIFSQLEEQLNIQIPEKEKKTITTLFSIRNVRKIAKQFHDFRQCDPYLGIHGKHITKACWMNDLSYQEVRRAFKKNFTLRENWGYNNCKAALEIEEFRVYNQEQLR